MKWEDASGSPYLIYIFKFIHVIVVLLCVINIITHLRADAPF